MTLFNTLKYFIYVFILQKINLTIMLNILNWNYKISNQKHESIWILKRVENDQMSTHYL